MNIHHLNKDNLKHIEKFFSNVNCTLTKSCLQGYMGDAWANDIENPTSVQIVIADFCFFSGIPNISLVKHKPKCSNSDFIIMIPENEEWSNLIEKVYKENCRKVTRFATKKEKHVFDEEKLKAALLNRNPAYDIKLIDEETFNLALENEWSKDLCSRFKDYEEYKKLGLGAAAYTNDKLVSGASSYTVYKDGIEIEVDTDKDYREKGLAYLCCCKLILECIKKNFYPSWDAQNKFSLSLAEKLGYHFDKEYPAYEIYNW